MHAATSRRRRAGTAHRHRFLLAILCLAPACSGDFFSPGSIAAAAPDGGTVSTGTGTGAGARQTFDDQVLPRLTTECGACHTTPTGGIGPGFMAPMPDVYTAVLAYTSAGGDLVVPGNPRSSTLVTKGAHPPGPAFSAASLPIIEQWITAETAAASP
jgi:hypothetical protein